EADLKEIHSDACLSIPVFRFFAEEERGNVTASAEEKSVAELHILCKDAVAADQRKDDGKAVGIPDRLNIRIGDKLQVSGKAADDDSDFRFHRMLLSVMYDRICKKMEFYSYHREEENQ